jgi:hypothetical protein
MTMSLTLAAIGLTLVALAGAVRRLPARARADAWMFLALVAAPAIALVVILSMSEADRASAPTVQDQTLEGPSPSSMAAAPTRGAWRPKTSAREGPSIRTARSRSPAPARSVEPPGSEAP